MLSFHLACSTQEALPNTDSLICQLDISDVKRLIQLKVVKAFETDQYDPSDVECLPYFDDFRLTLSQIEKMFHRCQRHSEKVRSTPGFKSPALDSYEQMLRTALETKCELVAYCD